MKRNNYTPVLLLPYNIKGGNNAAIRFMSVTGNMILFNME
jgi:hypothetical protein